MDRRKFLKFAGLSLAGGVICPSLALSCTKDNDDKLQNEENDVYFVGRVTKTYDIGCMLEVTDLGNFGQLPIGSPVQVNTSVDNCPEYTVGDYLKVVFDGTVAESYPPQILYVTSIEKIDISD